MLEKIIIRLLESDDLVLDGNRYFILLVIKFENLDICYLGIEVFFFSMVYKVFLGMCF